MVEETIDWARNTDRLGFMGSPKLWREGEPLAFIRHDVRYLALIEDLQRKWEAFEVPSAS
jgi:hypothetical protein